MRRVIHNIFIALFIAWFIFGIIGIVWVIAVGARIPATDGLEVVGRALGIGIAIGFWIAIWYIWSIGLCWILDLTKSKEKVAQGLDWFASSPDHGKKVEKKET